MKLWSIQPISVYESIMETGKYICDPEKASEPTFFTSYDWLNLYLDNKDPKPDNVQYPVWAWFRFNDKEKKPDLRHSCYGTRGERMVCLELDVPDEKVLLSDFDLWHFPLNNWWLDPDMFRDDYTEFDYDKNSNYFKSLSEQQKEIEKKKSWEIIFNIDKFENEWIKKGSYVQAIFWVLKKEYIKKVQYFTAR